MIVLGSAVFSTLSTIIASLVKTQERFLGIGQLLTMPLFFASNEFYSLSRMRSWQPALTYASPLTNLVDASRRRMVVGYSGVIPVGVDLGVLFAVPAGLVLVDSRLYPRRAQ